MSTSSEQGKALFTAANEGNCAEVTRLLAAGADINYRNEVLITSSAISASCFMVS